MLDSMSGARNVGILVYSDVFVFYACTQNFYQDECSFQNEKHTNSSESKLHLVSTTVRGHFSSFTIVFMHLKILSKNKNRGIRLNRLWLFLRNTKNNDPLVLKFSMNMYHCTKLLK